jgi:hypothetical protein
VAGQDGNSHQHRYAAQDDQHFGINPVARALSSRISAVVALVGLSIRHAVMS